MNKNIEKIQTDHQSLQKAVKNKIRKNTRTEDKKEGIKDEERTESNYRL